MRTFRLTLCDATRRESFEDIASFVGEDASIRAVNLTSGQVTTAAGTLHQDFTFLDLRAVAARFD